MTLPPMSDLASLIVYDYNINNNYNIIKIILDKIIIIINIVIIDNERAGHA